ncbi:sensor histidine kinase [Aliiroseovarius sp. YM-037]|uniref:sensor histidine kinase n=1 Tax=Aliiroseovarius sp. YM-037 TaxID=3341728 RepID=UPI003A7FB2D5
MDQETDWSKASADTSEHLKAALDSFRQVVENSPFGIYTVDADFRLSMVSAGARKTFDGVSSMIGRDFAEVLRIIWPEPFASGAIKLFRHTLETGEPYHSPATIERRSDTDEIESYDWKIDRMMLPDGRLGVVCNFYDLSERERYQSELRKSEARFRAAFENAAVGIAHVGTEGSWLQVNQRLCDILGYSEEELNKLTFQDLTHPDDLDKDLHLLNDVLRGKIEEYDMEKRYFRKDGAVVWGNLTVSCIRLDSGKVDYFISVVEDITMQKAAMDCQRLLVNELNHRVKNSLATIQAMASHTLRNATDLDGFAETFTGRLRAISASHDSIFQSGTEKAYLKQVIKNQLAPYAASGADRLRLDGPRVSVDASCAHALGLIFHELATNASKYGALSNEEGHITVKWAMDTGSNTATVTWIEQDGPPVAPPAEIGFGSRLIETSVSGALNGGADFSYDPAGLRVVLRFATVSEDGS